MIKVADANDSSVQAIKAALEKFKNNSPDAKPEVYRYNPGSIRARVLSKSFSGLNRTERHDRVWPLIDELDNDVVEQLTMLLLLTPEEAATGKSLINLEFEDPSPSML